MKPFNTSEEQLQLAAAAAAMRYRRGFSQKDIAEELGINDMRVSRLLKLAEDAGFVKRPKLTFPPNLELAYKIQTTLQFMRRIKVVITHPRMSAEEKIEAVAMGAAETLEHGLRAQPDQSSTGLGSGRGIAKMGELAEIPTKGDHHFYTLSNIPWGAWIHVSADTNLSILKRRFPHISIHPLYAMQLSKGMSEEQIQKEQKRILDLEYVQHHLTEFRKCSMVFTGVGAVDDTNFEEVINGMGVSRIDLQGASGDLSYNLLYHREQVFGDCALTRRVISVPMSILREMAHSESLVTVVAWGARKARPILDAYRARLINSLVIDTELAESLLTWIKKGYHQLGSKKGEATNG